MFVWISRICALQAPHNLYKPHRNVVTCKDPVCTSLHWPESHPCHDPNEQCDYEVAYADSGSSLGVLVKDTFVLRFTNGSTAAPHLIFGWETFIVLVVDLKIELVRPSVSFTCSLLKIGCF